MGVLFTARKNECARQKQGIFSIIWFCSVLLISVVLPLFEAVAAAPLTPTTLTATAASSRQINLSWKDNATNETNYYVERSPNGSNSWKVIATLGANVKIYQNTGLTQNTTYYYRVRCKAGSTYSSYTNITNAKTATLAAPTALAATAASVSQINLFWADNTTYEINYYVERGTKSGGPYTKIASVGANVTVYANTGLSAGTTYYYRVRAYDGTNYSTYSNIANETILSISASAGTGGGISPAGVVLVKKGASQTYTITPNTGYRITSVVVDGISVGVVSTYTFSNVTASHTITANFAVTAITYTITASASADGTIYPEGTVSVSSGASATFTIMPNPSCQIKSVLVDGITVGPVSTYTFTKVTANHTISANFEQIKPTVSIISPAAGFNNNNSPLLIFTVSDGSVVVKLDGVIVPKASGEALDPLADGLHTVRVEATNMAGYIGFAEIAFTIDTKPPSTTTLLKFVKPEAGGLHSLGVAVDGSLWGWGSNFHGQVGDGTYQNYKLDPIRIGLDSNWASISGGDFHSVAVKTDGTLWAWGSNKDGQLGDGTSIDKHSPIRIGTDSNWAKVSAGGVHLNYSDTRYGPYSHTVALKYDGTLWAWGANNSLQLGDGTTVNKYTPVQIGSDTNWIAISAGGLHTVALKSDGTIWGWGENGSGQLGDGYVQYWYPTPVQIGTDTNWVAISAGNYHTMALKSDGTLWGWGYNYFEQLGDGTDISKYVPTRIGTARNWIAISAGAKHTAALKSDGTVWWWGYPYSSRPLQAGTDTDWTAVSSGHGYSMALKSDGTLCGWGDGSSGQLGNGTFNGALVPQPVNNLVEAGNPIVINSGAQSTSTTSVTLSLNIWDTTSGVAFMKFSNDGIAWTIPEPYATTGNWTLSQGDGVKTVSVMFQDAAGNWSPVYSSSINLDTTPPTVAITSPKAGFTNNSMPLLTFTVSDGMVIVKVDGVVVNKVAGNTLDALVNGSHTVRVEATDSSGNTGFAEVNFTVITAPPTVEITSPSSGSSNNRTPVLAYTVSNGTAVVKVDGIAVNKVSGDLLDTLVDGGHTVRVEATDVYGAMSFAEVTFTIDTAAPTINIISPTGYLNSNNPYLTFMASDGIAVVKVDGAIVSTQSGTTLGSLADGSHSLRVESIDGAGNIGFAEVFFTIDTSSSGNDDANSYCMGTANYLVGPSNFTSGISVPPAGTNAVWIASPGNGETVNTSKMIVKGAMDTTVPVMGVIVQISTASGTATYPVAVNGKYFAAQVPLATDSNTITVIATDQNSVKHQASITVTGGTQMNTVDLQAMPNAGIMTLKQNGQTTLDVILSTNPSLQDPIATYAWDFNGTGSTELTCYSHATVTASYQQTGLYLTQVAVSDTLGNRYDDTVIVNVMNRAEIDALLKAKWEGMKAALASQHVTGAAAFFSEATKGKYQNIFDRLFTQLPEIAANMREIKMISVTEDVAEYRISRTETINGQNADVTYFIYFVKDENGLWKIESF